VIPETHYARHDGLHIAYQVFGEGPPDILFLDQWFGHLEAQWDVAPLAELRERLASFGRLIMYDKRGSGLSDPLAPNQYRADLLAIVDKERDWTPALPRVRR